MTGFHTLIYKNLSVTDHCQCLALAVNVTYKTITGSAFRFTNVSIIAKIW